MSARRTCALGIPLCFGLVLFWALKRAGENGGKCNVSEANADGELNAESDNFFQEEENRREVKGMFRRKVLALVASFYLIFGTFPGAGAVFAFPGNSSGNPCPPDDATTLSVNVPNGPKRIDFSVNPLTHPSDVADNMVEVTVRSPHGYALAVRATGDLVAEDDPSQVIPIGNLHIGQGDSGEWIPLSLENQIILEEEGPGNGNGLANNNNNGNNHGNVGKDANQGKGNNQSQNNQGNSNQGNDGNQGNQNDDAQPAGEDTGVSNGNESGNQGVDNDNSNPGNDENQGNHSGNRNDGEDDQSQGDDGGKANGKGNGNGKGNNSGNDNSGHHGDGGNHCNNVTKSHYFGYRIFSEEGGIGWDTEAGYYGTTIVYTVFPRPNCNHQCSSNLGGLNGGDAEDQNQGNLDDDEDQGNHLGKQNGNANDQNPSNDANLNNNANPNNDGGRQSQGDQNQGDSHSGNNGLEDQGNHDNGTDTGNGDNHGNGNDSGNQNNDHGENPNSDNAENDKLELGGTAEIEVVPMENGGAKLFINGTEAGSITSGDLEGKELKLFIDGTEVGSLVWDEESATYVFDLDTTAMTDGDHVLVVKACDGAGNEEVVGEAEATVRNDDTSVSDSTPQDADATSGSEGADETQEESDPPSPELQTMAPREEEVGEEKEEEGMEGESGENQASPTEPEAALPREEIDEEPTP